MNLFTTLLLAVVLAVSIRADDAMILNQDPIGDNACGPCALVNFLANSAERYRTAFEKAPGRTMEDKARWIVKEFGSKPSVVFENGPRYSEKVTYATKTPSGDNAPPSRNSGMQPSDLAATANDVAKALGLPGFESVPLDIAADETPETHLTRVHSRLKSSVEKGLPCIVSLRAFAPRPKNMEKADSELLYQDFAWEVVGGHYVVVTSVQSTLREGEAGFTFEFLDSATGKKGYGFANCELKRDVPSKKYDGWLRFGGQHWHKSKTPYLLVTCPTLDLGSSDTRSRLRVNIVLNHALIPKRD